LIGTANPIAAPALERRRATMPTTNPSASRTGPPLFPGFTAADV
jgi:hypothetical protein